MMSQDAAPSKLRFGSEQVTSDINYRFLDTELGKLYRFQIQIR
jgi:hypothetical protein